MKQAIIAIEDRRFYTNAGIDLRGIGRALWQDVRDQQAVQGGSTITMQFVKNALAAQDDRTLFQKLREAALAYQITRKWSKERILRNYLNTIYFGNGAYGIEAAARTYFGANHPGCGEDGKPTCAQMLDAGRGRADRRHGRLAERLRPAPAPRGRRQAPRARAPADASSRATSRRSRRQEALRDVAARRSRTSSRRSRTPRYPYFTSWVKQQVVDKLGGGQEGARRAFEGGLTVQTTLDSRLQDAARAAPSTSGCRTRAARARRSSRSTTTPARCSRWSAATTTRRARSTSPRRASASPAPRSSRSCSPRR